MNYFNWIAFMIVFFGTINLFRMSLFLIGSDWYEVFHALKRRTKRNKRAYKPMISVVIPAYNEENLILRSVESVVNNTYPQNLVEIIVANDGSTDRTVSILQNYKKKCGIKNLKIVTRKNAGKAHALNNAMKNHAHGDLVMCLDSDSYLDQHALEHVVQYFSDKTVMALASNVKIAPTGSLFNLIQQFEYIICYQMKRAHTLFNIEYIIGGIGSTFRKSILDKIDYYDTDTVTEDIDITMKILQHGNKKHKVQYGADVIAYTESVLDIGGLIKQRFRWKYGRSQTFFKHAHMFFNTDKKYTKGLTWFYLPFAIFSDLAFFLEPIMITFILAITLFYKDYQTLLSAFLLISLYISLNIIAERTISLRDKCMLLLWAPSMYFYFYILSYVEYLALIKTLIQAPQLTKSIQEKICGWDHVERRSLAVS